MELDTHAILALMHLLFIVPLFLFIGINRGATPAWLFQAITVMAIIIFVYHGWKLFVRLQSRSSYAWVNAIHLAFVAPLLLYIGYHGKESPRFAYELLLMLAFAAGGYHLYSLGTLLQLDRPSTA